MTSTGSARGGVGPFIALVYHTWRRRGLSFRLPHGPLPKVESARPALGQRRVLIDGCQLGAQPSADLKVVLCHRISPLLLSVLDRASNPDYNPTMAGPSIKPLAAVRGDPTSTALPKADLHVHAEAGVRLDRAVARHQGQYPFISR